jgi:sigma-E factor negative regulatory protein RseC
MENIQEGLVTELEGPLAKVNIMLHASCDNCGACQAPDLSVLAHNPIHAQIGQKVKLILPQNNMFKISFILFALPLIAILTGSSLGYFCATFFSLPSTLMMLCFAGIFLLGAILNIFKQDKKFRHQAHNFAQITEIIR